MGRPDARLHGGARPPAAARRDRERCTTRSPPDEVLTFCGAEEAIFVAANVLLGPGDHAIVTWPAYQSLHEVARAAGADVTLHELRASEGWAIDVERLRAQVTPRTKLIVVNAPHNPTGMLPDAATYREVAAIAADAGATLSQRRGLPRTSRSIPPTRLPPGADVGPHGVSLGVMSKSFAMAGLRIGWLATHDRALLEPRPGTRTTSTICSSAPSEILALIALRARDEVIGRTPRDHRRRTSRSSTASSSARPATSRGSARGRLDRLPGADRRTSPSTPSPQNLARRRRGTPGTGVAVRPPGQPLPPRVRADRVCRRARAVRGVRRADARVGDMATWIYFIHPPRIDFAETMTAAEDEAWGRHWQRIQRLYLEGRIVLVGPTLGRHNTGHLRVRGRRRGRRARVHGRRTRRSPRASPTGELRPFQLSLLRGRDEAVVRERLGA